MTSPAKFRAAIIAALTRALPAIVDEAWRDINAPQSTARANIRRREAASHSRRMKKNQIRGWVKEFISEHDKDGLTLDEIRRLLAHQAPSYSEHTLKRALQDMRVREEIETRNSRWHLAPPHYDKSRR